jgi:hypothetical protein
MGRAAKEQLTTAAILESTGTSPSPLKTLIEKGLVVRNSKSLEPFSATQEQLAE